MAKQIFILGDNIEELKKLPDNSVDAIVTDAPYGLGKEPDAAAMLSEWLSNGFMAVEGGGFMGKKWDSFVPQPVFWKEVIRVLKPGAHVLCFFGTRTYDWGVMAMRLAGFEIRDQVQWLYGSGFPKSLNISKAIDKTAGATREVVGKREHPTLKDKTKVDRQDNNSFHGDNPIKDEWDITAPATEGAKKWDGWGSALKPANEPIVLARKPLEKNLSISENVLKWGTGGINIDACRIGFSSEKDKKSATFGRGTDIMGGNYVGGVHGDGRTNIPPDDLGRFPANILLDEEAAAFLDNQSGNLTSGVPSGKRNTEGGYHGNFGEIPVTGYGDTGGASRFFYVAKASRAERNKGLEDFEKKTVNWSSGTQNPGSFQSEGTDRNVQNFHPTVKPIKLMQYLVRMITPEGGICMDPFSGSGTTGIACAIDSVEFMGVDNVPEYVVISNARIKAHRPEPQN